MSASVTLEHVRKRYGDVEVLRGIDLHIPAGQTVALIGPSGSGKSTLLRLLMTLEQPDAGRVLIDGVSMWTEQRGGQELPARAAHLRGVRGRIGMVFQHFNLFPHMTALRNVAEAPRHVLGLGREEAEQRAREYLDMVGLGDKLDQYPGKLSGGQKQRVAIARALAVAPQLLILDEPTSALDAGAEALIAKSLRETLPDATIIVITHKPALAQIADATVTLEGGHATMTYAGR